MFAARINEASVLPLKSLYLVPSGCWTEEVQRFIAQILDEPLGLTGKDFYMVTRKGLFGVCLKILNSFLLLTKFSLILSNLKTLDVSYYSNLWVHAFTIGCKKSRSWFTRFMRVNLYKMKFLINTTWNKYFLIFGIIFYVANNIENRRWFFLKHVRVN